MPSLVRAGLADLGRGTAPVRTPINDRPSGAYLLKTRNAELTAGHLAANIRNTRANYARPRAKVEEDYFAGLRAGGHSRYALP
jgi:hypothetical protein